MYGRIGVIEVIRMMMMVMVSGPVCHGQNGSIMPYSRFCMQPKVNTPYSEFVEVMHACNSGLAVRLQCLPLRCKMLVCAEIRR